MIDQKLQQSQLLMNENSIENQKQQDKINDLEGQIESLESELKLAQDSSEDSIKKLKEDHKKQLDAKETEIKDNSKKTEGSIQNLNDVVKRLRKEIDEKNSRTKQLESDIDKMGKEKGSINWLKYITIDSDTKSLQQEKDKITKELQDIKSQVLVSYIIPLLGV